MPKPRNQIVDLNVTNYFHCISRCVRRAFLCGEDRNTGRNFDHRKLWIADRLRELTDIFAIDVCSYGLMSNHHHSVLHVDWSRALSWSDDEVADRYACLFKPTVDLGRSLPAAKWAELVSTWRSRLYDLSWFMRCLNESIARSANREDGVSGRFWEGRFRSQALLDTGALLTCMAYVDLNPIRAGIADTLEESLFTSIRERLISAATPQGLAPFDGQVIDAGPPRQVLPMRFDGYVEVLKWSAAALRQERAETDAQKTDEWVSPPDSAARSEAAAALDQQQRPEETETRGTQPVEAAETVTQLAAETVALSGAETPGVPPLASRSATANAPPLLQRMGLDGAGFLEALQNFPRSFFTMIGHVQLIDTEAARRRYRRRPGRKAARRLYSARAA
ncbi:MAG TPA: hypothetical protein VEB21_13590 [Terriglobales bacterium]|nr:hypothetical protein [Terriglobales bacterium]